ncbi:MAG: 3-phosphoshikimate 1-carboxyvinyltransferase, partial [Cytophaga sp.]|uniref:3-phosphoshikimate 1-carboxyvinyltransferase n=1 Tax=Cytophaga sp. TaxID=29535 RepID=UPI003F7DD1D2
MQASDTTAQAFHITHASGVVNHTITPPASKSESNRVLVIDALTGRKSQLDNLSNARDTQTMIRLLDSDSNPVWDVLDAGTTMRFLTAFSAFNGKPREMTGTPRMKERPIKLLVDALRELGAVIEYKEKDGYPPILIHPFKPELAKTDYIKIKGDVSSQYITALLMIAPVLPKGLTIELLGHVGSKPYIEMTLRLMERFGIASEWKDNIIKIAHQTYKPAQYTVESDWSGSSYWFSIAALAKEANIELKGYVKNSLQGDHVIVDIMDQLGVKTEFTADGLKLTKQPVKGNLVWDFTDCPDLAQTVAVILAAKGVEGTLSGLQSLRIKETDRIAAIQNELRKFGADMIEIEKD